MADLARLRKMPPFAELTTQQFRTVVQELRSLFEPSTSGGSLGSYASPTTRAIRGLPAGGGGGGTVAIQMGKVTARFWDSATGQYWCLCEYQSLDPWLPGPTGEVIDQVVYLHRGQAVELGSFVFMFKRNASDTWWFGAAMIEIFDFENNQQWNDPDCAIEDCAPPVPPDSRPADWDDFGGTTVPP